MCWPARLPAGGCGALSPITHTLDRAPRVFTLQLAWESQQQEPVDIAATLAGVQEQVGAWVCSPLPARCVPVCRPLCTRFAGRLALTGFLTSPAWACTWAAPPLPHPCALLSKWDCKRNALKI